MGQHTLLLERWVQGTCMQTAGCGPYVHKGHQISVRVSFNGAVPSGAAVWIVSDNAMLLLPNGTKSQTFAVPIGATSFTTNLTAQLVTAPSTANLTLIDNQGVRRVISTQVIP